jgi:hypothetical protein
MLLTVVVAHLIQIFGTDAVGVLHHYFCPIFNLTLPNLNPTEFDTIR